MFGFFSGGGLGRAGPGVCMLVVVAAVPLVYHPGGVSVFGCVRSVVCVCVRAFGCVRSVVCVCVRVFGCVRSVVCVLPLVQTQGRGWGLRTAEPLKSGQFVIEYVGEVRLAPNTPTTPLLPVVPAVTPCVRLLYQRVCVCMCGGGGGGDNEQIISEEERDRRAVAAAKRGVMDMYFMELDKDATIDARLRGNLSRFINHSCTPNCELQKWFVAAVRWCCPVRYAWVVKREEKRADASFACGSMNACCVLLVAALVVLSCGLRVLSVRNVGGLTCIGVFTLGPIPAGTELTYDYQVGARSGQRVTVPSSARVQVAGVVVGSRV